MLFLSFLIFNIIILGLGFALGYWWKAIQIEEEYKETDARTGTSSS